MYEDEVCPRLHTLVTPWIVEIEHKALIQVRQLFFYFLDEALVICLPRAFHQFVPSVYADGCAVCF